MIKKEWILTDDTVGVEKLKLVGFTFLEDDQPKPRMVIYLRKIFTDANGVERSNVTADYSVEKGAISLDIDGNPLPKNELQPDGSLSPVLDEEGNPVPRDNAYENIKAMVDSGISPYVLIDAGVKERFKIA